MNLASRLMDAAGPHEIFALPELAAHAPAGTPVEPVGMLSVAGFHQPRRGRAARVRSLAPGSLFSLTHRATTLGARWKRSSSHATATSPGSA